MSLALRKYKKVCKIPKIILVLGFCPLKTEITRFPVEFHLNTLINSGMHIRKDHQGG